jgi:ketosteroid isomerase-like protein
MGAQRASGEGARAADRFLGEEDFAVQLREAFRRWNEADFDGATALMDPEVEWHTSGVFPDLVEVYRGRDGIKRFWGDFTSPWEEIVIEAARIEADGDDAVVDFRFRARGRGGVRVDMTIFHRFRRRNGLTWYVQSYASREEALTAAGLAG